MDPELGTGAVKLTPAHDVNDLECAARHDLPGPAASAVIGDDGAMLRDRASMISVFSISMLS